MTLEEVEARISALVPEYNRIRKELGVLRDEQWLLKKEKREREEAAYGRDIRRLSLRAIRLKASGKSYQEIAKRLKTSPVDANLKAKHGKYLLSLPENAGKRLTFVKRYGEKPLWESGEWQGPPTFEAWDRIGLYWTDDHGWVKSLARLQEEQQQ